jgi:O-antigen/teichoic acid export membrane protein
MTQDSQNSPQKAAAAPRGPSLGSQARAGARWTSVAQVIEVGSGFAILVYLARIVRPDVFGLVSLATAIVQVVSNILCAPVTRAVIAHQMDSERALSTAWWATVLPSGLAAVVIAGVTAAVGYRGSALAVMTIVAASLPLSGVSILVQAILQQQLRFRSAAVGRIIAAVASSLIGVGLGMSGFGLAALVSRAILPSLFILGVGLVQVDWWPRPIIDRPTVRSIKSYAVGVAGFSGLNAFNRYGDNLLVGSFLGSAALGLYAVAYRFIETPLYQVGSIAQSVSFPALVRIKDPARFRDAFLRSQKLLVWIVAPIGICSLGLGDPTVRVVLGQRWHSAGFIVQIFGAVALLQIAGSQVGVIYMARDATRLLLRWALISTPIILGSFAIGLLDGIRGVAIGYLVANIVLFYPLWQLPGSLIDLTCGMVLRSLKVELGLAFALGFLLLPLHTVVPLTSAFAVAGFIIVASVAYWVSAVLLDRHLRAEAFKLLALRRT